MERFTVDTHLFRELGELLVGRDSTALIELIKNSYDADATKVIVFGQSLSHPTAGLIRVVDNGTGMKHEEFVKGFLRIASRGKEEGKRRSSLFKRRFTGEKGIGRLAAHKLARLLIIESVPKANGERSSSTGLQATIDWDAIENFETLEDINTGVEIKDLNKRSGQNHGTTISLKRLRRKWSMKELTRFITEVQTFTVPPVLLKAPKSVSPQLCLFKEPVYNDVNSSRESFEVVLDGDFSPGDEYWEVLGENADWLIEIDASRSKVKYLVAPTAKARAEFPDAKHSSLSVPHPNPSEGPFFQARILLREGRAKASKQAQGWLADLSGIRVFMEGFRVLPYGDVGNDWLSLDAAYTRRGRKIDWDEDLPGGQEEDPDAGLIILPNRNYFGGVFLTSSGASALRMLVNREGFVPEGSFELLRELVRRGIDLTTRARAAAKLEQRQDRRETRAHSTTSHAPSGRKASAMVALPVLAKSVQSLAHEARELMAKGNFKAAQDRLSDVNDKMEEFNAGSEQLISEASMVRVLASVGTQMAAFVHEINSLLGMTESLEVAIGRLIGNDKISSKARQDLGSLRKGIGDLRRHLERNASYLVDVVTPDARRRRVRQSLAQRFDSARQLIQSTADRKGILISNTIDAELKSPPMFPAELITVFSNLLSNAIKAAHEKGKIRAHSRRAGDLVEVTIENTGTKVNMKDAEKWFRPFESTTTSVDPLLGQGMGLGLPITRNMLEQYGASVRFVSPSQGFATAVSISFPT